MVLAAAPDHRLAAPVSGRYRGTGVESHMHYTVALRTAESEQELNVMDLDQPISLPPRERWREDEADWAAATSAAEEAAAR